MRPLAREYRRWQLARAQLVKQTAKLLALIDELAEQRLQPWPPTTEQDDESNPH